MVIEALLVAMEEAFRTQEDVAFVMDVADGTGGSLNVILVADTYERRSRPCRVVVLGSAIFVHSDCCSDDPVRTDASDPESVRIVVDAVRRFVAKDRMTSMVMRIGRA